jgi:hypothetical protein
VDPEDNRATLLEVIRTRLLTFFVGLDVHQGSELTPGKIDDIVRTTLVGGSCIVGTSAEDCVTVAKSEGKLFLQDITAKLKEARAAARRLPKEDRPEALELVDFLDEQSLAEKPKPRLVERSTNRLHALFANSKMTAPIQATTVVAEWIIAQADD